jgi:hypothetical protein
VELKVTQGNHKLDKDTLILNITSATDCPSKALGLCKLPHKCYAMKAERMYKQSLPFRRAQAEYWDTHNAEEIANALRARMSLGRTPIKYLRISEAGDFKNQRDVEKLWEISKLLETTGVIVYGYTARSDLDFSQAPNNVCFQGSGFMIHNSFTAVPKEEAAAAEVHCAGNCRLCNLCKSRAHADIKVGYH